MLRSSLLFLLAAFVVNPSVAQSFVELQASKDNTLYEDSGGNFSNGAGQHLFAGTTNLGELRRGLIAFDLSGALPEGSIVDSVQVQLTMNKSRGTTHFVHLHRMAQDWGEGSSDSVGEEGGGTNAAEGDATWLHAVRPTVSWSRAGGDFRSANSGEISVGSLGPAIWYNTNDLLDDVNHWLANPSENFGWLVMGDEIENASAQRFASRENPEASTRPVLRIYYSGTATYTETTALPGSMTLHSPWPNPFQNTAHLSIDSNVAQQVQIDVLDVRGRLMSRTQQWIQAGSTDIRLNGSQWSPGVYLVRINGETTRLTRSLVRVP